MIDTFTGISLSPVNSNVLWAIAQQQLSGQYIYRIADGGAAWTNTKIDNTLNPGNLFALADPLNVRVAWASSHLWTADILGRILATRRCPG
ncbi:MAG: hypothetical protein HY782_06355 [Chloroflexi bacterium]|nr:hypothetical protein [Chloroflexota bacterium]